MRESPEAFASTPPVHLMDRFPGALLELRDNGQTLTNSMVQSRLLRPR